jgi:isocitrate/isopropylmalate dehydrogenase
MRILVLPGDGIGPEITAATVEVLGALDQRLGLRLEMEQHDIGLAALAAQGTTLPDAVLQLVAEVEGTVLGPVSHYDYPPRAEGGINPSADLRTRFELFANIRRCRSVEGPSVLPSPMDLVIVRENTEGFYSDRSMHSGKRRVHAGPGLGVLDPQGHGARLGAGRPGRVRAGPDPTPPRDCPAQGQRAQAVRRPAVSTTIADPQTRTRDLGGALGTHALARAVIDRLDRSTPALQEETHA